MPITLETVARPLRTAWNAVAETFVMLDGSDRQLAATAAGGHADLGRLAALFAASPDLYDAAERLLPMINGADVRVVDGRLVFDESDFDGLVEVMNRIKDAMPKAAAKPKLSAEDEYAKFAVGSLG